MKNKILFIMMLVVGMFFTIGSSLIKGASASESDYARFRDVNTDYCYYFKKVDVIHFGGYDNTIPLKTYLHGKALDNDGYFERQLTGSGKLYVGYDLNTEKIYIYSKYDDLSLTSDLSCMEDGKIVYDFSQEFIDIVFTDFSSVYSSIYFNDGENDDLFWRCCYSKIADNGVKAFTGSGPYFLPQDGDLYFGGYENIANLYQYLGNEFNENGVASTEIATYDNGVGKITLYWYKDSPEVNFVMTGSNVTMYSRVVFDFKYEFKHQTFLSSSKNIDIVFANSDLGNAFKKCFYSTLPANENELIISGVEKAMIIDYDNPILLSDILENVKCIDDDGVDVTDRLNVETTYPNGSDFSSLKLGDYEVNLSCTDSSGNVATFTIVLKVVDLIAPVISGSDYIKTDYKTKISIDEIKSKLTVSDNHDNLTTNDLVLVENSYSGLGNILSWQKLGFYSVKFTCTDSSGNVGEFTVNIEVVDNIAPIIKNKDGESITEINIVKERNLFLSFNEIYSLFTLEDEIDGVISNTDYYTVVSNSYENNANKVGKYVIGMKLYDFHENAASLTINIEVVDKIAPVFVVNKHQLFIKNNVVLTENDVVSILKSLGYIDNTNSSSRASVEMTNYTENAANPGIYTVSANILSSTGVEKDVELLVNVSEHDPNYNEVDEISFFQKIINFFKITLPNVVSNIGEFFTVKIPNAFRTFGEFFKVKLPNAFGKFFDLITFWK